MYISGSTLTQPFSKRRRAFCSKSVSPVRPRQQPPPVSRIDLRTLGDGCTTRTY